MDAENLRVLVNDAAMQKDWVLRENGKWFLESHDLYTDKVTRKEETVNVLLGLVEFKIRRNQKRGLPSADLEKARAILEGK